MNCGYKEKIAIWSGRIIGDYIAVGNANGDVCSVANKKDMSKIYPKDIPDFIKGLKEESEKCNDSQIIEYRGLKIQKGKEAELEKALEEACRFIDKNPLHGILIR